MKLEQGDLFEQTRAAWIRENLPNYESIWSAFIGHDGTGRPLPMPNLPDDKEQKRKLFFQAHHSFAITAYQLSVLAEASAKEPPAGQDVDAFLQQYQRLFLCMGYVGHVRDMFKQMSNALNAGEELHRPFQDFYQQRCHVLHGPRPPMRYDDLSWVIPVVAGQNERPGEWHRLATWDSPDYKESVYVPDFIVETRKNLFALIASEHPKVFCAADAFFNGQRVGDKARFNFPTREIEGATEPLVPSGTGAIVAPIHTPAVSGQSFPNSFRRV